MLSRCLVRPSILLVFLSASPAICQDKPRVLTVCAEAATMPRTGKTVDGKPQGVDVAVVEAICQSLGWKLDVHWCASPACSRSCLREKRCDVILGHPHDPDGAKDIAWTVPYVGSQFGLVVPKSAEGIKSLADLRGKRLGIVVGTAALSEKDYVVGHFKTRVDLLEQFQTEKLDGAFLDADFASWYLHHHPKLELKLVQEYVPREHWNMAMAVRAKDAGLVVDLNKALAALAESGGLREIYAKAGVAFRPPFTGTARKSTSFNTWKRIQERGVMTVSMDPANLPFSGAKGKRPGFDVELLELLAAEMGVKLKIDWLDVHRATAIGKLMERESDIVFGTPVDANAVDDDDDLSGKLLYSIPYYGSGYVLVKRKQAATVSSLADLKGEKARRLAAEAGSIADYRLRQRGMLRSLFANQLAVLKAIHDGTVDYGYLWANIGYMIQVSPDFAVELIPGYVPEDHWNIAVAMRHGDDDLKRRVDAALEKLIKNGSVKRIVESYHVPYFTPFAEPKNEKNEKDGAKEKSSNDDVIRHPKVDRGLEPQMQFLKVSKNPYVGMERVRSAGELVVGLDQRNLPFSSAHPKPSGLDYEIAELLAKKLGVSLRIYWAYSAHDSYPSKLATRKLCDVMLNVMPDARFGDRVLYTKPYYLSSYRFVVKKGSGQPSIGADPLAVERGAFLRGIPESTATQEYASVDAILEAVAKGGVKAGYVIATRGQSLAERDWPGQLAFLDGMKEDRLPICAAVRKSDVDLKSALERAFAELTESGELVKVFERWRVPYVAAVGYDAGPKDRTGASNP